MTERESLAEFLRQEMTPAYYAFFTIGVFVGAYLAGVVALMSWAVLK